MVMDMDHPLAAKTSVKRQNYNTKWTKLRKNRKVAKKDERIGERSDCHGHGSHHD